jgi:hypothetical protein
VYTAIPSNSETGGKRICNREKATHQEEGTALRAYEFWKEKKRGFDPLLRERQNFKAE